MTRWSRVRGLSPVDPEAAPEGALQTLSPGPLVPRGPCSAQLVTLSYALMGRWPCALQGGQGSRADPHTPELLA